MILHIARSARDLADRRFVLEAPVHLLSSPLWEYAYILKADISISQPVWVKSLEITISSQWPMLRSAATSLLQPSF
jgi:hypothetical protein